MKTAASFALALSLVLAGSAHARGPSMAEVENLQDKITDVVMGMKGVNGIGIGLCAASTGRPSQNSQGENCIALFTESEEAAGAFLHHRDHHLGARQAECLESFPDRVVECLAFEDRTLGRHKRTSMWGRHGSVLVVCSASPNGEP